MLYINNASEKGVSVKFLIKIKWLLPALMIIAGPLQAGTLKVVASIPPVHSITAQVMEGAGVPALLIKAHQSPHHFSLKPSTAAALNRADVIIIVHPHLEEGLARALEDKQDALVVLVDHDGDPHAWLDPLEGVAMAAKIAEALSTRDPANAALYQANARALQVRLGALKDVMAARVRAHIKAHYIVVHDGFGSFERAMGIKNMGALAADDHVPASARRITELRKMLMAHPGACVFSEPQFPVAQVRLLTKGTGARQGRLDPLGASFRPGPALYEAMLKALAEDFAACFEG